jgi:hypothetical protein
MEQRVYLEFCNSVAEGILERVNSDPTFMKRIVINDKMWVYEFDMQTSQQASEWRLTTEPKPIKPRKSRSKVKVMLTVFLSKCYGLGILAGRSNGK